MTTNTLASILTKPDEEPCCGRLMRGYGYDTHFVEGDDPAIMHQSLASTLDAILARIRQIQSVARSRGETEGLERPHWPMIVFRTPRPDRNSSTASRSRVPGARTKVPIANFNNPEHLTRRLDEELPAAGMFDEHGKFREELAALAPTGHRRMGSNPHANGGELLQPLSMPHFHHYAMAPRFSRRFGCATSALRHCNLNIRAVNARAIEM